MRLTAAAVERSLRTDEEAPPLGSALASLAVDVETDAVAEVRDVREQP